MGDDLNFAQKFTRTAADGLALISQMENPRAVNDAAVVIDMMTTVQRGAKRLRARHIYSCAQDVLSALHHEDDVTLHGRIENLGCVVTEYARGLEDLLQAPKPADNRSPVDKWEMARDTLNALLPTASPDTADMLSRLMRAPVTLDTVRPESTHVALQEASQIPSGADIMPFAKLAEASNKQDDTPLEAAIEDTSETASTEPSLNPQKNNRQNARTNTVVLDDEPLVSLDAMMRDVIADALSVARKVGRTISLSYDMGDRTVSEFRAEDLRGRLGQALAQIIRQSLTNDRVGHIDINLAGQQLHIMAGTTALRVAIDPDAAPAAKPLITTETEQGLRAQLNALMDPISLHETAS